MPIVYTAISALFILLSMASVIGHFLEKKFQLIDLKARILSWWGILGVFSFSLLMPSPFFIIFLAFISFIGLREFLSAIPTRFVDRQIIFILYVSISIQYILVAYQSPLWISFLPLYMFLLIAIMATLSAQPKDMLVSIATLYCGLMLTVFCVSHLGYLSTLPISNAYPTGGAGVVLYLVVLTQLNDVAQYCWGNLFKGRKILPQVSPNKTVSGFIGGVITIAVLSIPLGSLLMALNPIWAVLCGLIIAISGFLGDLFLSAIKRDLKMKDFSTLIPGHGGMLDRLDSLIIAAPVFYQFIQMTHVGGTL